MPLNVNYLSFSRFIDHFMVTRRENVLTLRDNIRINSVTVKLTGNYTIILELPIKIKISIKFENMLADWEVMVGNYKFLVGDLRGIAINFEDTWHYIKLNLNAVIDPNTPEISHIRKTIGKYLEAI